MIETPYLKLGEARKDLFKRLTVANCGALSKLSGQKGVFFTDGSLALLRNYDLGQVVLRNFLGDLNGMRDLGGMTSGGLTVKVIEALKKSSLKVRKLRPVLFALVPADILDERLAADNKKVRHVIALDKEHGLPFPKWFDFHGLKRVGNIEIAEVLLPALKKHVQVWWELPAADGSGKPAAEYVTGTIGPALEALGKGFSAAIPLPGVSHFAIYKQGIEVATVRRSRYSGSPDFPAPIPALIFPY